VGLLYDECVGEVGFSGVVSCTTRARPVVPSVCTRTHHLFLCFGFTCMEIRTLGACRFILKLKKDYPRIVN
jgi:hypothetical protein